MFIGKLVEFFSSECARCIYQILDVRIFNGVFAVVQLYEIFLRRYLPK